ncbi:sulfatase-like hydrolase/transferase [Tenacibaculum sp. UWU-22]|uniref:sulfatase-like hydrolase/transferase n=1 Tax=Tenacibaculum sp. UWU-22 TaxID=3234187 RepID=UPI0034DB78C2
MYKFIMKNKLNKRVLSVYFVLLALTTFFVSCKIQSNTENTTRSTVSAKTVKQQPNIIYILTDDLGYGDIGVFFQNQRKKENDRSEPWLMTPNLDEMAKEGVMLTHHYAAAPVCAPSRASLLSGLSQGHANVRNNQFDKAIADNYTLGNVMQQAGYATAAIGKWGLQGNDKMSKNGDSWPGAPLKRGFDYFYGYMRHSDGHEHYPVEGVYRKSKEVYENNKVVTKGLDKCYTGDLWTSVAKKWITEQVKSDKKKPFFMYLAYDTPHAVIELPTQAYPKGGGLNGGLQWIGKPGNMINTASGKVDSWVNPNYDKATYDDDKNPNTPELPWPDVYKRYATVVQRIDNQVGDILKLLADLKIDDNTLVVFSSDNGPSIESYLPKENIKPTFFNSFGPFDGIKRDVLEGGERMPTIVRWPTKISPNRVVKTPSISYDWLPTFTDAAGLPAPVNSDGVSLLPSLTEKRKQQESLIYVEYDQNQRTPSYDEFAEKNRGRLRKQMQMIRMGDIVGLRYNIKNPEADFELYNILEDTHQSNDLANQPGMAEIQKKMKERVLQVRMPNSTAKRPYDNLDVPSNDVSNLHKGLQWKAYKSNTAWLSKVSGLQLLEQGTSASIDVDKIKTEEPAIIVFEGYIYAKEAGTYTFYLSAADKAFMRIHDASIIDADYGYKAGKTVENTIKLAKGYHAIRVYYRNEAKTNKIDLQWEGPGFSKTPISKEVLFSK